MQFLDDVVTDFSKTKYITYSNIKHTSTSVSVQYIKQKSLKGFILFYGNEATIMAHKSEEKQHIIDKVQEMGIDIIGFAHMKDVPHPFSQDLVTGIALVVSLDKNNEEPRDNNDAYSETHITKVKALLEEVKQVLGNMLNQWGYQVQSIGNSHNKEKLTGEFAHKTVAHAAGLGWIGKSSLFVSYQFGPRVRLSTLLTDALFSVPLEMPLSLCGDCNACIDICPAHAIRGNEWVKGSSREYLLDPFLCSEYRAGCDGLSGAKRRCALCMKICPKGKQG